VLRRVLAAVSLAALGLVGVASATSLANTPTGAATTPGAATATTGARTVTTTIAPTTGSRTVTTTTGVGTVTTTSLASTTATAGTTTTSTTSASTTTPVVSASASTIVFTGHGWGHGMGMAQWGADGYAQHGWTYAQILQHYYPGTTVAAGPSPTVRVLLREGRKRVTIDSASPWQLVDATGARVALAPGRVVVPASLAVNGQTFVSPLVFAPGGTPLEVGGKAYRGRLIVLSAGKSLQLVNALNLDSYIRGVVGGEMPTTWPAAALEAQAVAARSYALAQLQSVVTARGFDVYSDTRSQVYGGIAAEAPSVTSAVQATARLVVLYDGRVATTYFSSSSGGRTASAAEVTGKPIPYLVSVDDPYDTLSPYHDWGPTVFDARKAGKLLGALGTLLDLQASAGPSGHNQTVAVVGSNGTTTASGPQVRLALGLRSAWFSVGWLSLTRPAEGVTYGGTTTLTGTARGVGAVSLEAKLPAGVWQPVSAVAPDASGVFSIVVKPDATTQYRLAAGDVRAAVVKVPVVPLVQAGLATGAVEGTLRPALGGAPCQLQRESGAVWATVGASVTDPTGAFAVPVQVTPGSYRVRCAPGHGLSPGISQPLAAS
jgi:stage II sporulation protein D